MKNIIKILIGIAIAVGLVIAAGSMYVPRGGKTPSIAFAYPAGGETITTGSAQTIRWNAKNIPSTYKIAINIRRVPPPPLQEEGQEFDPLIFTNLPNTGSAEWAVSDMYPAGDYILGITAYESVPVTNPITAESGKFSIVKAGTAKNVLFRCDQSKSIQATFFLPADKYVYLQLSDGRILSLPHAVSASGARYANPDETFVFWNKGDTAFITEGKDSAMTYTGCVLKNQ